MYHLQSRQPLGLIIAFAARYCRYVAFSTFYDMDAALPCRPPVPAPHIRMGPPSGAAHLYSAVPAGEPLGGGGMTTTRSASEGTSTCYGCVLCGRVFLLPSGQPALPAHVYPRGLFRGRPCASAYGVPVDPARDPRQP